MDDRGENVVDLAAFREAKEAADDRVIDAIRLVADGFHEAIVRLSGMEESDDYAVIEAGLLMLSTAVESADPAQARRALRALEFLMAGFVEWKEVE